jgi:hypothetical protein
MQHIERIFGLAELGSGAPPGKKLSEFYRLVNVMNVPDLDGFVGYRCATVRSQKAEKGPKKRPRSKSLGPSIKSMDDEISELISITEDKLGISSSKSSPVLSVKPIFSARAGRGNDHFNVSEENLHPLGYDEILNVKVEEVDAVAKKQLPEIHERVAEEGLVAFAMQPGKMTGSTLNSVFRYFIETFAYTASFYGSRHSERSRMGPDHLIYVCFMDLPVCMPIMDPRKVGGMGLRVVSSDTEKMLGRRGIFAEADFVGTTHEENVFYLDGCRINKNSKPFDSGIGTILPYAEVNLPKKEPKKAEPAKKQKEVKYTDRYIKFAQTEYKTYTDSSTSVGYYYQNGGTDS